MNDNNRNAFDIIVKALRQRGMDSDEILSILNEFYQDYTTLEILTDKNLENKISEFLKEIGMPMNIYGYQYWVKAIWIYKINCNSTKKIYEKVAKIYDTKAHNVEIAMLRAIKKMLENYTIETIPEIFKDVYIERNKKISNMEFLLIASEQIK